MKKVKLSRTSAHQHVRAYFCTIIFASFVGTYLDLWFVGKGLYSFPGRPFPNLISINILFTLGILPISTFLMIHIFNRINRLSKYILSILVSLSMAVLEHVFEGYGFFAPSSQWKHGYSILGYLLFIVLIWQFYRWLEKD